MTSILLLNANSIHIPLADNSVHCVVTSPPYWGLRDYGTAKWECGDPECDHQKNGRMQNMDKLGERLGCGGGHKVSENNLEPYKDVCLKCGARRVDNQLGLEPTPEEYIEHMATVFREVKRVLRDDGTLWLNIGDSYAGSWGSMSYPGDSIAGRRFGADNKGNVGRPVNSRISGVLKPKDLVGIPWRLAFALQADGWWLRSDIIWSKPNPMPESVTDRPTKAHEYLFLLAKSEHYFYDQEAIREPIKDVTLQRLSQPNFDNQQGGPKDPKNGNRLERRTLENLKERYAKELVWEDRQEGWKNWDKPGRNRRTVWEIATAPYAGAHFATYPPALVEPCIKAGTSARGVCPVCGKPWEREIEKGLTAHDGESETAYPKGSTANRMSLLRQAARERGYEYANESKTTGWRPACSHDAEPIPAVVFDPFAGSGTTLMVARQLGRRAIGLDLSYAYLHDQARARLELDALDAWQNGIPAQEDDWSALPLLAEKDNRP